MKALVGFFKSFLYAFKGIFFCIKTCRNFRFHTVAAVFVLYFSGFYEFERSDSIFLYMVIGIVLSLECINTAIEQVCNKVTTEHSDYIMHAKDAAAGAVLCSAIFAVAVAFKLFYNPARIFEIIGYFSNPIKLLLLAVCVTISIIYIFYEDIFKNEKK